MRRNVRTKPKTDRETFPRLASSFARQVREKKLTGKMKPLSSAIDRVSDSTRVDEELSFDHLKLQFLANMNHELRTPLNGIMGATELLSHTQLDAEQQYYLDIFKSSSRQLLSFADNVFNFTKLLSGGVELKKTRCDLKQMLEDCLAHFKPFAQRKGLDMKLMIAEDVPRFISAEADAIMQIVYHLVSNAMKFTGQGEVNIAASRGTDTITLRVSDTGRGIALDKQECIFEAFYQEDTSHTRMYGGAGMGLAISRLLAKAMNGDLRMNSVPNHGSEFSLTFPFFPSQEWDAPALGRSEEISPKILLVEDNEINQAIVYFLFSKRGITIDIAKNGLDGLECHKAKAYDLIFMDMQMPVMDGIEATREIRKFDPSVCIVALTANLVPEDQARAMAAGMNDFLCKPLDPTHIDRVLEQARNRLRN